MNLLIISYQFSLENSTGSLRMRAFHKYLRNYEIQPFVVTNQNKTEDESIISIPDYFGDRSKPLRYYGWRILCRFISIIGIPRTSFHFWKKNVLQHAEKLIIKYQPSVILASYPSIENLEVGLTLSERFNIPLITDFRDGLMFEPIAEKMLKTRSYRIFFNYIEQACIEKSNVIISVTEPISDYFKHKSPSGVVTTLPNGYDFSDLEELPDINLGTKINIVHTGKISASQPQRITTLKKIIDALEQKNAKTKSFIDKICIHFIGELTFSEIEILQNLVKIGVIKLHGSRSRAYAVACQNAANALLLVVPAHMKSIATGKVFEYIAARKPILAIARETAAEKITLAAGLGISIDEDNQDQITSAFQALAKEEIITQTKEDYIATLSRESQTAILASIIKSHAPQ